jgi:hypothetical protein
VKDLYNENCKTLKTLEDGKTSYVHGSAELIVKIAILLLVMCRFNLPPSKFSGPYSQK